MQSNSFHIVVSAIEKLIDSKTYTAEQVIAEVINEYQLTSEQLDAFFIDHLNCAAIEYLHTIDSLQQNLKSPCDTSTTAFRSPVVIISPTKTQLDTKGKELTFYYGTTVSKFGEMFACWNSFGLHALSFCENLQIQHTGKNVASAMELEKIKHHWPLADFQKDTAKAKDIMSCATDQFDIDMPLWLKATDFQLQVWRALLNIAVGETVSYQQLATQINNQGANRAVGSAVGKNPIALMIPCHRVIKADGTIGQYKWGSGLKTFLLSKESRIKVS